MIQPKWDQLSESTHRAINAPSQSQQLDEQVPGYLMRNPTEANLLRAIQQGLPRKTAQQIAKTMGVRLAPAIFTNPVALTVALSAAVAAAGGYIGYQIGTSDVVQDAAGGVGEWWANTMPSWMGGVKTYDMGPKVVAESVQEAYEAGYHRALNELNMGADPSLAPQWTQQNPWDYGTHLPGAGMEVDPKRQAQLWDDWMKYQEDMKAWERDRWVTN